jgi:photosynthetic reaction center H subunit
MHEHEPKIVPLRLAADHGVAPRDTDPRGLPVIGADGKEAGKVGDLWIDRCEMMFRYLEVRLPAGGRVLLPIAFARIRKDEVVVDALLASQFGNVPALARNDQITMLEEEKVSAYYGAGTLYATPDRQEPLA